jgi:hypothetical protein
MIDGGSCTAGGTPVVAIARAQSLGAAAGTMLMGGVLLFAISPVIGKLRALLPIGSTVTRIIDFGGRYGVFLGGVS